LPPIIVNQIRVPQSGSFQASARMHAVSDTDGGLAFGFGAAGASAKSIGLIEIHLYRTARRKAPLRIW
jgi:hypothetical protein